MKSTLLTGPYHRGKLEQLKSLTDGSAVNNPENTESVPGIINLVGAPFGLAGAGVGGLARMIGNNMALSRGRDVAQR